MAGLVTKYYQEFLYTHYELLVLGLKQIVNLLSGYPELKTKIFAIVTAVYICMYDTLQGDVEIYDLQLYLISEQLEKLQVL